MTPNDSRPPGCTGHTPFEEELVNAMNDFVKAVDAPNFDAAGIVRRTRRKRATTIAGVAAALIVAGGGTALATAGADGSHPTSQAISKAAAVGKGTAKATTGNPKIDQATMVLNEHGVIIPVYLGRMDLATAKGQLLKADIKLGTVKTVPCLGKPGTVLSIDPHSPTVVTRGAGTVDLNLCSG